MSDDVVIRIKDLTKVYKMYETPVDRMKEALHPFHKRYSKDFYALQNFSLDIHRGDTVGFIGKNGAGKSTLLKMITGVLTPTSGAVEVHGRIASLLELGAGFNPEMTGIENIFMNGMLMGCSREKMAGLVGDITDFADIGDFIQQPVKTYSSGMFARLAFAVNAFVEPDILIVDEALSVGDAFFQAKCIDKMKQMMENGITVLFVSHDIGAVKSVCSRGVLLEHGRMVMEGTASEVVEEYNNQQLAGGAPVQRQSGDASSVTALPALYGSSMDASFAANEAFLKRASYQRVQNGKAEFVNVELLNEDGRPIQEAEFRQPVVLRMSVVFREAMPLVGVGYAVRSSTGVDLVYGDSRLDHGEVKDVQPGERYVFDWRFKVGLQAGSYSVVCAVSRMFGDTGYERCDFVPCAVQFSVQAPGIVMGGFVHWPNSLDIRKA